MKWNPFEIDFKTTSKNFNEMASLLFMTVIGPFSLLFTILFALWSKWLVSLSFLLILGYSFGLTYYYSWLNKKVK